MIIGDQSRTPATTSSQHSVNYHVFHLFTSDSSISAIDRKCSTICSIASLLRMGGVVDVDVIVGNGVVEG